MSGVVLVLICSNYKRSCFMPLGMDGLLRIEPGTGSSHAREPPGNVRSRSKSPGGHSRGSRSRSPPLRNRGGEGCTNPSHCPRCRYDQLMALYETQKNQMVAVNNQLARQQMMNFLTMSSNQPASQPTTLQQPGGFEPTGSPSDTFTASARPASGCPIAPAPSAPFVTSSQPTLSPRRPLHVSLCAFFGIVHALISYDIVGCVSSKGYDRRGEPPSSEKETGATEGFQEQGVLHTWRAAQRQGGHRGHAKSRGKGEHATNDITIAAGATGSGLTWV